MTVPSSLRDMPLLMAMIRVLIWSLLVGLLAFAALLGIVVVGWTGILGAWLSPRFLFFAAALLLRLAQ